MEITELKNKIEKNTLDDRCLVFKCADGDFIARQYIREIAKNKSLTIQEVDTLEEALYPQVDIFSNVPSQIIVCHVDEINDIKSIDNNLSNVYIIAKKVKNCTVDIVTVPKLETWQVLDYAYTRAEGVNPDNIETLVSICGDIDRLDKELDKIALFDIKERNFIFEQFLSDGIFSDLSTHTIFDFVDAIIKKDMSKLTGLYKELEQIDCEPMALLTILNKQFRNIILVQLSSNPTANSLGLSDKQIWAIKKYSINYYNRESLLKIYDLLTGMDLKIKSGEFPMENRGFSFLLDYLVTQILTA